MTPGSARGATCALLACWLALACSAAAPPGGDVPVEIALAARALEPGEPVRVTVRTPVPLSAASASFLGRDVALAPASDAGDVWRGWGLIGLDDEAGPAAVEASGTAVDGRPVAGTLAVTVAAKPFPEERLDVQSEYVEPPAEVTRRLERERARLAEIYRRRDAGPRRSGPFVRPVSGEPTSVFGTRRIFNGQPRSPHPGLDLRAAEGTEVLASGPGTVVLAGDLYYSGNTVILDHGGGLFTLYAHLSRVDVEEGERVEAGRPLGRSGSTGRVTGPHLHWGAKIGDAPFDPRALLDPRLFDEP